MAANSGRRSACPNIIDEHLFEGVDFVKARRHSFGRAKPSTRSTRTRPYQLRSKIAIWPGGGNRCQKRQR